MLARKRPFRPQAAARRAMNPEQFIAIGKNNPLTERTGA